MQKIIEFKQRNFWSNQVNTDQLNQKIAILNKDGWSVKSITTNSTFFGAVSSYSLLLELNP